MIILLFILFFSVVIYNILYYRYPSILEKPVLAQLVFWRDYIFFTMLSYLYDLYDNYYKTQYILSKISSNNSIINAGIFSFIFIVLFLITFNILYPARFNTFKKINIIINYNKLLFILNLISWPLIIYFFIITFYYKASIIGILKYNLVELSYKRHELFFGHGILQLHKFFIKYWIPMLSYLMYYLYLKKILYKKFHKMLMLLLIIVSILASLWYFEKSPIVFYILGLGGIYLYSGYRFKKKYVFFFIFIAFGLISISYLLIYKNHIIDMKYLIDIVIHRTVGQGDGSIVAFDYFENHKPFGLSGISNILAEIKGETFKTPYAFLINYYDPSRIATSGSISSFAAGEAFGLFGYIGIIIGGVIVGIYYAFFEATKASSFLSVIFVSVYGYYFAFPYVATNFYTFVWPINLIIIITPIFILTLFSIKKQRKEDENINFIRCQ